MPRQSVHVQLRCITRLRQRPVLRPMMAAPLSQATPPGSYLSGNESIAKGPCQAATVSILVAKGRYFSIQTYLPGPVRALVASPPVTDFNSGAVWR